MVQAKSGAGRLAGWGLPIRLVMVSSASFVAPDKSRSTAMSLTFTVAAMLWVLRGAKGFTHEGSH